MEMIMGKAEREDRRSKPGRFAAVLACVLAVSLLAAGCSPFQLTPVSLLKDAVTNAGKAESVETEAAFSGVFTVGHQNLSVGMDIQADLTSDLEMTREPGRAKGVANVSFGVLGSSKSIDNELFLDTKEKGSGTLYIKPEGEGWKKKDVKLPKSSEETDKKLGTLMMGAEIINLFLQNPMNLELDKEMHEVKGKEAYRITAKIPGKIFRKMLEKADPKKALFGKIDFDSVNWDEVLIPSEIYIYKAGKLPARIVMDCGTLGTQFGSILMEGALEKLPLSSEDFSIESKEFTVDLTFDRYNEIDTFEIPGEVKESASEMEASDASFLLLKNFIGW